MLSPFQSGRRRCLGRLGLLAVGLHGLPALADPLQQKVSRPLLGTQVDILARGQTPASTATAINAAFAEMARLERMMSRYRPDSQVSALQRSAGRNAVVVGPELMAVLKTAGQVSARTHGAFDATVGVYSSWDFSPAAPHLPSAEELRRQSRLVAYRDLVLDEASSTAFLRRPGMRLDLGGIAKLPILNAGFQVLLKHGLHDVMVNGGGDVLVSSRLQGSDWRIGVRDPRLPERLLGIVSLDQGIVASSGDYERCFVRDGHRYHHILDPRTGQPSTGVHGVVMVSRRLEAVNGLGAATMVAGAPSGKRLLGPLQDVDSLIVDASSQPWMSERMAGRFQGSADG